MQAQHLRQQAAEASAPEQADELERQAAEFDKKAADAESQKQAAAEQWASKQAEIADIEAQEYGKAGLEVKLARYSQTIEEIGLAIDAAVCTRV